MKKLPAALTALVLTAALAGCSAGSASSSGEAGAPAASGSAGAPAEVNDVDTHFVAMMTPHHEQAVEMSKIILAVDGVSEPTRDLAQRILDGQTEEIGTMRGWADAWGMDDLMQMHSVHVANGMLTSDQMGSLERLADASTGDATAVAAAETTFLELMHSHHEGAIAMTQGEIEGGGHAELRALAQVMVDVQTAEMAEIDTLLGR
ncbi:DUF305 domain-containing protein [Oerskovia turbata]|uniref:DUF305 domain-containing protein n=1 Tax=Oerskovia turbata TaxID=1713 RepID=A0A4Q1KQW8_9CELL|nr:DUF305 domain-containing protein [Oerskovia turbata]RXR22363.1 DUF305 domain-containing protein [Oerskovia turbata]RXR32428.1 DUF305 domain-containing protein [Oerskovia turbata]TGJ95888.1 DUF305 domain-containing protein [Actinotalea fermentans ATCC 43279 = JCM 9966 = DSM 3133]